MSMENLDCLQKFQLSGDILPTSCLWSVYILHTPVSPLCSQWMMDVTTILLEQLYPIITAWIIKCLILVVKDQTNHKGDSFSVVIVAIGYIMHYCEINSDNLLN